MEILRPSSLWLLALVPLVWWWHMRSIAPLRGRRKIVAAVLRCALAAVVVLALSEPRWQGTTQKKEVLVLVDQSLSMDDAAVAAAEAFAARAEFDGADVGWIGFAGGAGVFRSLDDLKAADESALDRQHTRLDTAIQLAAASFRPGRVRTMVVFSDGVSTAGSPSAPSDQDVRIHTVTVQPPARDEVLVREVVVPTTVRANDPVRITATLQGTSAGPCDVDLFRNGVRVGTKRIDRPAGASEVVFDDRAADEKLLHYEVAVRAEADTIAENNRAGAAVLSQGAARVMLLSDRPESARYLEWALKQEGIQLAVRPPEGWPNQLSDLQNFDAVLIDNVPASSVTRSQMELLRSYVSDFGGGVIMLGGDQAYGLGGYFRTAVEDILPVRCDFQKEEESPSLGLALVIDRSGSMSGEKMEMAKAAAKASVDLLGPRDYASVIAFDGDVFVIVPIQAAGGGIGGEIATITPGGGTDMAPGMEEALRQLSACPAKLKHVILLTDGVSQDGPFQELTSQMVQNNITVSTVAVGTDADTQLLAQIAEWGNGRSYETTDPSSVPQIFTKETMTASKSAIQEFPFLAKPVRAADFLEGVPWETVPFLLGYVRTKPKPTSETWLVTDRGDPLLTTWRFGLGTTAAFTSDARNRWAIEWLRWKGFGKFWAQLLRRTSRSTALGRSEVNILLTPDAARITVDALDDNQRFPEDVTGELRLADPTGAVKTFPLEKLQPGRWQVDVPTTAKGIFSGQVVLRAGDEPFDSRFLTFARGYSAEFLLTPPDTALLGDLADSTGGTTNPDPATIFRSDKRTARAEQELWPWLALLALLGFVADVAVRRWPESLPTS